MACIEIRGNQPTVFDVRVYAIVFHVSVASVYSFSSVATPTACFDVSVPNG